MSLLARIPLFWRFQLVGWGLFAVGTFPLKLAAFPSVVAAVVLTLTREPLGLLLSSLLRSAYGRLPRLPGRDLRFGASVFALCFLAGSVDTLLGRLILARLGHHQDTLYTVGVFSFRGTLYVAWTLLYFWIKAQNAARERELNLAHAETRRREAELQLLRAQINPHFLFNALNTLLATVEPDNARARRVVEDLSSCLRYSLQHRHDSLVPLGAEYDATHAYLAVEQERFRGELLVDSSINDAVRSFPVPGVLIQPLVENAVKYSRETSDPPHHIRLRVAPGPSQGSVEIAVSNSGEWVDPSAAPAHHGNGLENLRGRLALLYPNRHDIRIATQNRRVTVTVHLQPPT